LFDTPLGPNSDRRHKFGFVTLFGAFISLTKAIHRDFFQTVELRAW